MKETPIALSKPLKFLIVDDSRAIQARGVSADVREGVGAFLEKRTAAFPDRVSSGMPGFFPWWQEPGFE